MIVLYALLGACAVAYAEDVEPAYPSSPPIRIDDAETVDPWHAEINLSAGLVAGRDGWEAEAPLVDANLGVTRNIHVNAEIPLVFASGGSAPAVGLGQAAVAVKIRVLHRDRVQIATHPAVELPGLPSVGIEPAAGPTLTVPVVVDLAVGRSGAGVGIQVGHTFTGTWADDGWEALVGFATPLSERTTLMFDYAQEAGATGILGEGWADVGLVHERLFGSDHLTLLSSLGRSTAGNSAAMLGVQVGI